MFDSLTKYVQHFRWISICFMIAKNVCLRCICIFPFCMSLLFFSSSFFLFSFDRARTFRRTAQKAFTSPRHYNMCLEFQESTKKNIYKYFDQIKETWKQVISNTDSYLFYLHKLDNFFSFRISFFFGWSEKLSRIVRFMSLSRSARLSLRILMPR